MLDLWAVRDFHYTFHYDQTRLYHGATTPVLVDATVYHVDARRPASQPGLADFELVLWLHTGPDLTLNAGLDIYTLQIYSDLFAFSKVYHEYILVKEISSW